MNNSRILLTLLGLALTCVLSYAILSRETTPPSQIIPTQDTVQSMDQPTDTASTQADETIRPSLTATTPPQPDFTPTPGTAPSYSIHWFSGFETGDLREWENWQGEFLRQGSSPYYQIVLDPVHNGQLAAGLTIDTYAARGNQGAYFAFYDTPDAGWYSTWYYIPEGTYPQTWWIIMQWKSTYNGNSDDSIPMWVINLEQILTNPQALRLGVIYRPDDESKRQIYYNERLTIPTGEWFHLSVYYKRSMDSNGEISVWLNGEEFLTLTGIHTALQDNTLYWSINNYSDEIYPHPATLYVDDVIISQKRIPPEYQLP